MSSKYTRNRKSNFFLSCHPLIGISKWYELWNFSSLHSSQITDVIRLLCGSLTVKNDRLGNAGTLTETCSTCRNSFANPIHHVLDYAEDFIENDCFPLKESLKKVVNNAIFKREESIWSEKINQKPVLKLYLCAHPSLQLSKWYEVWDYSPTDSQMVVDVIRLLCGSLKINNDRLGNPGTQSGTCSACARIFNNPIHHAFLYCSSTQNAREKLLG